MRATAIGFASVIALGVGLASPALAGKMGGSGGSGGGTMHGSSGGSANFVGSSVHSSGGSANFVGGSVHSSGSNFSSASMSGVKSVGSGPGMSQMGTMKMGDHDRHDHDHDRFVDRDRDHDRDRHHHDRFRFFAFNNYADSYYPDYSDCWEIHRVHTPLGWRLRRVWVCDYNY